MRKQSRNMGQTFIGQDVKVGDLVCYISMFSTKKKWRKVLSVGRVMEENFVMVTLERIFSPDADKETIGRIEQVSWEKIACVVTHEALSKLA